MARSSGGIILKEESIRPATPLTPQEARHIGGKFVEYSNADRLRSALGYVTPKDKPKGGTRRSSPLQAPLDGNPLTL